MYCCALRLRGGVTGGEAVGAVTAELGSVAVVSAGSAVSVAVAVEVEPAAGLVEPRRDASGEGELDEESEEAGDGGKNSGNAFFSIRCTLSSLNHDERTGTVQPGEPAADDDDTIGPAAAVRERDRVGDTAREGSLTGEESRRGPLSTNRSSLSFCRASRRRSDEMVGAASVDADTADDCLCGVAAVGLAAAEARGEEEVAVDEEVGEAAAESDSGLFSA